MGMSDIFTDWVLPIAGGLAGGYGGDYFGIGSDIGAGIGAGAGRYLGGEIKGEDSGSQVKNSLLAGALGYGGMNAYDKWGSGLPFLGGAGDNGTDEYGMMSSGFGLGSGVPSKTGSFLPSLSGEGLQGNMIPIMMGAGLLSEAAGGAGQQRQEEEYRNSLASALEGATWNDATRAKMMSGLSGQASQAISGAQRRAANAGAEAGRGGGLYGSATARAQQAARESIAKTLAGTYEPYSTNVAQLKAQSGVAPQTTMERLLGGVGDVAGKWPYLALMQAYGGR